MCYSGAKIFFPHPHGLPCMGPGVQDPTFETTGPEDIPGNISSLLPPSPSAKKTLSFSHFHSFPLVHHQPPSCTLLGQVLLGVPAGERVHPVFIPSSGCGHGPNSVIILLAPMKTKPRSVCIVGVLGQGLAAIALQALKCRQVVQAGLGFGLSRQEIPAWLLPGVRGVLSSGTVINEQG